MEAVHSIKKIIEILERDSIRGLQYSWRDTIEISNVPLINKDKNLEEESLDLLEGIGVE